MSQLKNTLIRVSTAVVALPLYIFLLVTDSFNAIPILIVSLLISLVCLYEFYQISSEQEEGKPFVWLGLGAGVIINLLMYDLAYGKVNNIFSFIHAEDPRVIFAIIVFSIITIFIIQIFTRPLKGGIYSVAVTIFGFIFIVLSFSHIILLKKLDNGVFYLIMVNVAVMMNDTGAYFGGVLFGKHKVGFAVSPNKSWEGYFSGVLVTMISMIILNQVILSNYNVQLFSLPEAAFLGILLSVFGHLGDLAESAVKRDGEIKDSGSIIPGHGGMWDVFDALIFTIPIFYYYIVLLG